MIKDSSFLYGDTLGSVSEFVLDPLSQASPSELTYAKGRFHSYLHTVSQLVSEMTELLSWAFRSTFNLSRFTLPANTLDKRFPLRHSLVARGQAYIKGFSSEYKSMSYFRNLNSEFGVSHT